MGATLTTVAAITKEVYGPRIVNQLENSAVLSKRIEKTSRNTTSEAGGKYVTFPLKVRRNAGLGYRNELEQLQAPGQQGWANVRVPLRYGYGRVHLSGQAMDLASENFQSFSAIITEEMEGLREDISKDTNRILWGDGLGILATVTADGVNTVTVSNLRWVDIGTQVDILSADGLTVRAANRQITAVNTATNVATYDGADASASIIATDIIVRTGNYGKEPKGLAALVKDSTSTLFNLSPATEPKWKAEVQTAVGTLSESGMVAMCDRLRNNGGRPTAIFTDLGSRRAYFNLLTTQRRFTNTKTFEGGLSGMAFAYDDDIPLVTDVDANVGEMYFLREDDFKIYRRRPWYWEDKDGNVWKWVTNFDAFEALMKQYWEFAIERRNTQGVMTGITAG